MKRNMELVRDILLTIEDAKPFECIRNMKINGFDKQEIAYHCELLYQAGFIKDYHGEECNNYDGVIYFTVQDLTWEGQDFLETIREKTVWENTKNVIREKGLPMVVGTIKTIANAFITAAAEGVANAIIKNGGQFNAN